MYLKAEIDKFENLRQRVTHMPTPSANKAPQSGFETQRRRHQKSKTGVSVAPQMDLCLPRIFLKSSKIHLQPSGERMLDFQDFC